MGKIVAIGLLFLALGLILSVFWEQDDDDDDNYYGW